MAEIGRNTVKLIDMARLARLGEFDPDYLYLERGPWTEVDEAA
jgi:hypothetical protein